MAKLDSYVLCEENITKEYFKKTAERRVDSYRAHVAFEITKEAAEAYRHIYSGASPLASMINNLLDEYHCHTLIYNIANGESVWVFPNNHTLPYTVGVGLLTDSDVYGNIYPKVNPEDISRGYYRVTTRDNISKEVSE